MRWRHRHLLASFVRKEVTSRYTGSMIGAAWALANPLALLAVYAFVFAGIFKVVLPAEAGSASYLAFVAVGLWPWLMFAESIERAMASMVDNAGLIRKVSFPLEVLVLASVLGSFLVHAVGYLLVLLVLRSLGQPLLLEGLPLALAFLLSLLLVSAGLGALLAAMQAFLPDTRQVVGVALTLLFFATPVLYPRALVPEVARPLIDANPIALILERLRAVLIGGSGPQWSDVAIVVASAVIFLAGMALFRRVSPHVEEFL